MIPEDKMVKGTLQIPKQKPATLPKKDALWALQKAAEWDLMLKSGKVKNKAEIAFLEGITRARVTQILKINKLPKNIQDNIFKGNNNLSTRQLISLTQNSQ